MSISVTPTNVAVLFLDLQEEIIKYSRTVPADRLRRTAGALARLAALHKFPAILSAVPSGGAFLSEVTDPLQNPAPHTRTFTTAFADASVVTALKNAQRNCVVLAGVASEVIVVRTALDALNDGYSVHVAVDACGGVDERTEAAAWQRIVAAGAIMSSVITIAAELTGDFSTELGATTLGIMYEMLS